MKNVRLYLQWAVSDRVRNTEAMKAVSKAFHVRVAGQLMDGIMQAAMEVLP